MAAIGLLGMETIKVAFSAAYLPVVDRAAIATWPQVRRGLYSEAMAEKYSATTSKKTGAARRKYSAYAMKTRHARLFPCVPIKEHKRTVPSVYSPECLMWYNVKRLDAYKTNTAL